MKEISIMVVIGTWNRTEATAVAKKGAKTALRRRTEAKALIVYEKVWLKIR